MNTKKIKINVETKKAIKLKKPVVYIPVPMYRCCVELYFGKQTKEVETHWKSDMNYDGKTRNYLETSRSVMITFVEEKPKLSTVVHELLHATQMIMAGAGHKCLEKDGSDEPSAYLLTFLFEEYCKIKKLKV